MQTLTTAASISETSKDIIKPSKQFKKAVVNSFNAILVFVVVYILLFLAAVAFAVFCGFAGVAIMSLKIHWLTVALGLALIASGLLLIFFLIKFLFKKAEPESDQRYEIFEEDQPQLFAFIKTLTEATGTDFPKHIYLSPEVNASVFYDSSFWSMFFPVKKNLNIGMGVVNSLNQSEFKTVLAHEFGHFSQRSMKFGSYVYNVNKIIYNLLFDNEAYGNVLDKWAGIHSFFRITAYINIKIITGIQYILRKIYVYVNKSQMRLSREMEYHADAIAAYVAGANNAITASRRIDVGQMCYTTTLNYWSAQLKNNKRALNIYTQQHEVVRHFAEMNNITLDASGLPDATKPIAAINSQQVVIADQWASHPTSEDREAALTRINITEPPIVQSAWLLFSNPEELQLYFTDRIYDNIDAKDLELVDLDGFKTGYNNEVEANSFDRSYKGYYNARPIAAFIVDDAIANASEQAASSIDDLLTQANCNMPAAYTALQGDIYTISAVIDGQVDSGVKTFDFRGTKCDFASAIEVKDVLLNDANVLLGQINQLDIKIFQTAYHYADVQEREKLAEDYKLLMIWQEQDSADYELYNTLIAAFNPVYTTLPVEQIEPMLKQVYELEPKMRARMAEVMQDEMYKPYITDECKAMLDKYLAKEQVYFQYSNYDNDAVTAFADATTVFYNLVAERTFQFKKQLLNYQLAIASAK